jgi:hypothetical protein
LNAASCSASDLPCVADGADGADPLVPPPARLISFTVPGGQNCARVFAPLASIHSTIWADALCATNNAAITIRRRFIVS